MDNVSARVESVRLDQTVGEMNSLDTVSVIKDSIRFRYFSVDGCDSGFQCISLENLQQWNKMERTHEVTHIVLHRPIPKLSRHNFQNLPSNPAHLRHRSVWIPIWRYLLETIDLLGFVLFDWVGHECRSHETIRRLPELFLRRSWDNWEMNFESS